MAEIIFGIDHGNGNMKGENVCFPCGLVRYVSEPGRFMNEDILEYQGTYYTLSDTKMPFKADKTVDDDYFILTLYALAMEARNKGITLTGKDVVLGVGLPPADYGQQATSFKKYFLDYAKHGISFKMNGKSVNFYLKDVFVSPQNFAAVMCFKASLLKKYRSGKLEINGKYTFLLPDYYAACEYWFGHIETPKGLLADKEVFCWLFLWSFREKSIRCHAIYCPSIY